MYVNVAVPVKLLAGVKVMLVVPFTVTVPFEGCVTVIACKAEPPTTSFAKIGITTAALIGVDIKSSFAVRVLTSFTVPVIYGPSLLPFPFFISKVLYAVSYTHLTLPTTPYV